jgi:dihydrofolate reductase
MRKLKLQMQISLDGFNSTGPNDEQKWVTWAWDEIKQYVLALAESCDTELIGRKLAVDYLPFWTETLTQPESMLFEAAKVKARQMKIVFSKTIEKSIWNNTIVANGDLKSEVLKLKNQGGKDIIVYGGSTFVSSLIREGLIDEFHFFINPIAIGKGQSAFQELVSWQPLKLVNSITCSSGIVILHYEKA